MKQVLKGKSYMSGPKVSNLLIGKISPQVVLNQAINMKSHLLKSLNTKNESYVHNSYVTHIPICIQLLCYSFD